MATKTGRRAEPRLEVRSLTLKDIPAIRDLESRCYGGMEPWGVPHLKSQIETFPEGQIGIEMDGKLVATSGSVIVDSKDYLGWHNYDQACGNGFLRNHDPKGDTLYGIDIAVDPTLRGLRLSRRLYDARKALVIQKNLRSMLIAGRIPNYSKHAESISPEEYVRRVVQKEIRDPVLTAQRANGFAIRTVLRDYLPSDKESLGNAVCMEWLNPRRLPLDTLSTYTIVRVAAVQYQMRTVATFEAFIQQCEFFADAAAEYRTDYLLYPEMVTNQLQTLVASKRPSETARRMHEFTEGYLGAFSKMAIRYNVNIIGGTHLTVRDGLLFNTAYLFRRDGSIEHQDKLHVTPAEERWWGVSGGGGFSTFDTDRGKIAILVGQDVEFPEVARRAASLGAHLFFVPFNTDIRPSYQRLRLCAHARAIENDAYVVMTGPVGNLEQVPGADIHFGQACVLTPTGIPFAGDGVSEQSPTNTETMLVHELDLDLLKRSRRAGPNRLKPDLRDDLYQVSWTPLTTDGSIR